jgi:hypothetical protein
VGWTCNTTALTVCLPPDNSSFQMSMEASHDCYSDRDKRYYPNVDRHLKHYKAMGKRSNWNIPEVDKLHEICPIDLIIGDTPTWMFVVLIIGWTQVSTTRSPQYTALEGWRVWQTVDNSDSWCMACAKVRDAQIYILAQLERQTPVLGRGYRLQTTMGVKGIFVNERGFSTKKEGLWPNYRATTWQVIMEKLEVYVNTYESLIVVTIYYLFVFVS